MNISTRQLEAFVAAARLGSFTRAAEQIHMTQAGLSLTLRNLERQLGCRLFNRTTRAIWLTDAGRRLQPVVERMLDELRSTAGDVRRLTQVARRTITVAATPLVCASILPRVFQRLKIEHPDIDVVAKDAERSMIGPMVQSGEVDVGLGVLFRPSSGLERQPLGKVKLVCVRQELVTSVTASPTRKAGKLAWAQLRDLPLISLPPNNTIQQLIDVRLREIGRANEVRPVFSHLYTLVGMAEAGLGAAILPSFVRVACERYSVRLDLMVKPQVQLDFYAVRRKGTGRSDAMDPFIECFVEEMTQSATVLQ